MTLLRLNNGATWGVVVDNGTKRTFQVAADGQLTVPAAVNISIGGFLATLSHANSANRAYTLVNRAGNIALEDATSLNAMLPSQAGNNNKFLQTDGAGVLSWATSAVSAITSLNGNTSASQTLTYNQSGTAPAWSTPNGTTVQLAIPLANTASVTAGLVSKTEFDNFAKLDAGAGAQTFANAPLVTTASTNSNALATYGQVLAARAALAFRPPVQALDTASTTLGTNNPVIDGYTIAIGDRVLATALTTNPNRVYKATGSLASITWTLETDGQAGTGAPTDGDIVFVQNGTTKADQQWAYNGTSWVMYNRSSAYTFSTGLTLTGTTVTVDFAPSGTSNSTQVVRADDSRLSDSRTPTAHVLDGALHTISGKTAGQMLIATAATTFAFTTMSGDATLSGAGAFALNATVAHAQAFTLTDAVTAATSTVFTIGHNSSGTAAAGFGSVTKWQLESSTTNDTDAADETVSWVVATHASRTARKVFNIYDTAAREGLRIEASGTAPMIGFLGANASARLASPDAGTALVTFGLASGTPTWALANVTGTLGVTNGGTGANLSATGGASQVLKQTSVGGAISVAQLSYADISGSHVLDSGVHTVSGKTAGQVLIATAATAFSFVTFGGDIASISAAGAVTVGSLGGTSLANLGVTSNTATLADNTAAATLVTGASYAVATYRSVRIEYQMTRGTGNYEVGYIQLLYDGTNARITKVEDDSIGTLGVTLTADVNGGNMRLLYTTTSTGTAVTMYYRNQPYVL